MGEAGVVGGGGEGVRWKIHFLKGRRGGFPKSQYIGRDSLKRRGLGQFPDLIKKRRVVFLRLYV